VGGYVGVDDRRAAVAQAQTVATMKKGTIEKVSIQMDRTFADFGITHTFETDHTASIVERVEQKFLPFFSTHLKR
jgi:hypothetical protein